MTAKDYAAICSSSRDLAVRLQLAAQSEGPLKARCLELAYQANLVSRLAKEAAEFLAGQEKGGPA